MEERWEEAEVRYVRHEQDWSLRHETCESPERHVGSIVAFPPRHFPFWDACPRESVAKRAKGVKEQH